MKKKKKQQKTERKERYSKPLFIAKRRVQGSQSYGIIRPASQAASQPASSSQPSTSYHIASHHITQWQSFILLIM